MVFIELSRWVSGTRDERGDAQDRFDAVAESRAEGHDCVVCKAARGDQDAFALDALRRGGGEMKITYLSRGIERWPNLRDVHPDRLTVRATADIRDGSVAADVQGRVRVLLSDR